jgi:hypothetical protein
MKTIWVQYRESLRENLKMVKPTMGNAYDIEVVSEQLQGAIITSYHTSCPQVRCSSGREVSWCSNELTQLRKNACKLFNRANKTGEWTEYSRTLIEYDRVLREAKKNSWGRLCQEIENISEGARLHRVLAKDPINPAGHSIT